MRRAAVLLLTLALTPAVRADAPPAAIEIGFFSLAPESEGSAPALASTLQPLLQEIRRAGLLREYRFLSPIIHRRDSWDLGIWWLAPDLPALGRAHQAYDDGVRRSETAAALRQFGIATESRRHYDELWKDAGLGSAGEAIPADAVIRLSTWTTRPGKGDAARAFWKPFAGVFQEMTEKGLLLGYRFVTPVLHGGQDWDLAYLWFCKDLEAFYVADQHFSEAVAKMDGDKIETDFEAAFDGSKHRDELWRSLEPTPARSEDRR
jgi:hypothetical protein